MRIAHVTATFPPHYTGTGMVCYYNALGLAQLGHDISVFTADYPPGDFIYPEGINVHRLPVKFRVGNAPLLPGLLGLKEFDIIHLHHPFIFGSELIWAVSKLHKIPYVITHHNDLIGYGLRRYLFDTYSAISTRLVFWGARKLAVVSCDHAAFSRLASLFHKRWDDTAEVPNGVDTELFQPGLDGKAMRRQCGISDDDLIILFVGPLDLAHHYRRVDLLFEAVRTVQKPNLHVLIAGDGDRADQYQNLAKKLGIDSRVHFLGKVAHRDLPGVYAAADVTILPSQLQESFGLVLIEAMACGKPVIASDLPGVRLVVNDGEDGLLVKAGDVNDLVEKIQTLLSSPQRRREMGERGRAKVEEKYAWPKILPRLVQVYEEVLANGATHG
ncbi:MAG: glycosyltransferase family 4 protein [Chloroflexi bacterium]|nr:glycosyltransferase family 4 protein [Chloroflexota bacterium]